MSQSLSCYSKEFIVRIEESDGCIGVKPYVAAIQQPAAGESGYGLSGSALGQASHLSISRAFLLLLISKKCRAEAYTQQGRCLLFPIRERAVPANSKVQPSAIQYLLINPKCVNEYFLE